MKNGKTELKPGDWFASGGKEFLFERIESGSAVVRDMDGHTFVYGLETFRRILNQIGYELKEGTK